MGYAMDCTPKAFGVVSGSLPKTSDSTSCGAGEAVRSRDSRDRLMHDKFDDARPDDLFSETFPVRSHSKDGW